MLNETFSVIFKHRENGSLSEESIMRMGRRMEVRSANLGLAMSNKWKKYGFSSGYVELPSKVEVSSLPKNRKIRK